MYMYDQPCNLELAQSCHWSQDTELKSISMHERKEGGMVVWVAWGGGGKEVGRSVEGE